MVMICLLIQQSSASQPLSFKNAVKEKASDADLQKGTEYRFSDVSANVDAIVKIEDLIGGAQVMAIDEPGIGTNKVGYEDAFQPLVYSPGGTGTSYALFSVKFVNNGANSSVSIGDFSATSLDLDGNAKMKEFSEVTINGPASVMNFLTSTVQISVVPVAGGFLGTNISGIEYAGIDTSALSAMYTVKRTSVNKFDLKFGAVSVFNAPSSNRQYSVYMKDFSYALRTLPVKLISFTATLNNNNKVDLKWTTSSEINASHFIVEKSTDGKNFSDAGMVFAFGTATTTANYMLTDNSSNNQTGVIYYRLRSFDTDGKNELSDIRIIRMGKQAEKNIAIITYPNPVNNEVRITIPAAWQNKKVVYEIINAAGKISNRFENASSSQTETVNVSGLASGFYMVRVNYNGQTAQQKIIKQ